ncbi:hypothetical protein L2737_12755 [Shewanella electrodiphila]|uniref:Uncharacterized protein n=1 Tax=Shewanella electrodiphila TaxID=934143 RepID=A0ABT0KQT6_9GAMM|nr:hypothetical protein [Shewanella electrodiphila]MCL1046192.1 hypothetical protein [Shewanella electrodiphila]
MLFQRLKIILLLLLSLSTFSAVGQVQLNDDQRNISSTEIAVCVQEGSGAPANSLRVSHSVSSLSYLQTSLSDGQDFISMLVSTDLRHKNLTPEKEQPLISQLASVDFFNDVRRVVSSDNRAGTGVKPNYFLQIAFFEPVIFNRFITPIDKPKFTYHWTSKLSSTVSRLSGWKDGNSLYSHHHLRYS